MQLNVMMSLPILQIAAVVAVAIFLVRSRARLRRRNAPSWNSLVTRLQSGWSARDLSFHFLSKEGLNTTQAETWERMQGFRGIRVMYRNAGVMLEMADYAARNSDSSGATDRILLETLRSDAMQIRLGVLGALAHYAFNQASKSVRSDAFRVASMYTEMAARMAQLLHVSAPDMLPDFVAAM